MPVSAEDLHTDELQKPWPLAIAEGMGAVLLFCGMGYLLLLVMLVPAWGILQGRLAAMDAARTQAEERLQARGQELGALVVYDPPAPGPEPEPEPEPTWIPANQVHRPESGDQYGHLSCERAKLDAPVYYDDTDYLLEMGAAQTTVLGAPPGFGQVIVICGHNNTDFVELYDVVVGDVIKFDTTWCAYEYTVEQIQVYNEDDLETLLHQMAGKREEKLVLYTCYPAYRTDWRKTDRLTVIASRTAGLDVR